MNENIDLIDTGRDGKHHYIVPPRYYCDCCDMPIHRRGSKGCVNGN